MKTFEYVKPGDVVTRMLAGVVPMKLKVAAVTDKIIDCGWTFDRITGAEIDEDLDWGPPPKHTGSYLVYEGSEDLASVAQQEELVIRNHGNGVRGSTLAPELA